MSLPVRLVQPPQKTARLLAMAKILLFRAAPDLSARLVSELARAGYDVTAPQSADVRTVLQHQPDLILPRTRQAAND
jgi:hypothetical protein